MNDGYSKQSVSWVRRSLATVIVLIAAGSSVAAQDPVWPVPGRAPDILVGGEYGLNSFDKVYIPMHQVSLYGGIRNQGGAYLLRVTGGKRFGLTGVQGEIEAYPVLAEKMYSYISYAYGETPVYPRHRAAVEIYRGLPWSMEGSIGARFFAFPGNESVFLGTGSLSYYTGNFILTVKPFVSLNLSSTAVAGVLSVRYYLSENEEYITGRIGGGFTPDERWIQTTGGIPGRETLLLESQTIGGGIQFILLPKVMFLGRLDVTRQEAAFSSGTFVIDLAIGCGVRVLL